MPPKENPERDCEECIHFFACSRQCGEQMAQRSATGCECYETVKSIAAARLIERLTAENAALREKQRWIPVAERLPEPETDVLAVCNQNGYIFVIPAIYEDGKMLTQDSAWNWNDIYCYGLYDEEADDYYIPEGWWEDRQFNPDDVYNNPVDCAVTHWMPLPGAPEEGDKADA